MDKENNWSGTQSSYDKGDFKSHTDMPIDQVNSESKSRNQQSGCNETVKKNKHKSSDPSHKD